MTKIILIASLSLLLTSCGVIQSSYHFTKGTEAIEFSDYDTAIEHLEEAVRLDPAMGRNYNNLGYAYFHMGRYDKAWYYWHNGVWAPLTDDSTLQSITSNFHIVWDWIRKEKKIHAGLAFEDVIDRLGDPDLLTVDEYCDWKTLTYGTVLLSFPNGILKEGHFFVDGKDAL